MRNPFQGSLQSAVDHLSVDIPIEQYHRIMFSRCWEVWLIVSVWGNVRVATVSWSSVPGGHNTTLPNVYNYTACAGVARALVQSGDMAGRLQ